MKIEINNLGPISAYEFDLSKDLNIIFGQNNIGKSYAITAIYLILKNLSAVRRAYMDRDIFYYQRGYEQDFRRSFYSHVDPDIDVIQERLIQRIKRKNEDEILISKDINDVFSLLINELLIQNLTRSFKNSFSSIENLTNKYSNEKLTIKLTFENFTFSITAKGSKLSISDLNLNSVFYLKRISTNRRPHFTKDKTVIYFNEKAKDPNRKLDLFNVAISKFYSDLRQEISLVINKIYFLPASRSGLYQALSTFSAIIAELSKSRNFLSNRIELPNISEPVSDYFLYLANISSTKTSRTFHEIISEIENEILKGEILFSKETNKIVFSPRGIKNDLDLSFTSSMISEIAPIVAFLKYIIRNENVFNERSVKGAYNVVFIEEPEAHLHPLIQVKLMELFSKLIKYNVKVIMTSHSNYMFNKLSNLILEGKVDFNNVGSYLMKMTEKGSVVDKLAMKPDKEGIKDENFADIASDLYEERISIYEKLNTDANSTNQS